MSQSAQQIENEVREVLESGNDIYQRVREITLKALTGRELDLENIKEVVEAALNGIQASLSSRIEPAKADFSQAVAAIDDALEKTAQASKLAIEEASSRVNDFSHQDLNRSRDDIKRLEEMFLETLENVMQGGNEMLSELARNFVDHARSNGTAVGRQAQVVLDNLNDLRRQGQSAVVSGVATTASTIAKMGSGILAGIAESLDAHKHQK